ncbi:DUF2726 domain-containing protein [Polaromonas sp. JS666]|uniref:DUF2726 domain-containing protein n=1 Tax=Polaromonas sp. (strain JS666 / ATCC BAA-500) TaxID=296591 RepID=UPI000053537A|nr:DUF2726 domain-containing protein [Polaromonas sp. JS666]ABE43468.1 hypothetical protein Bpro_1520 [Polaromonas sp. JS666]
MNSLGLGLAVAVAAVSGMALGALCHRSWAAGAAKRKKRIPVRWQLRPRPLLTEQEQEVWHWLKRAFFDQHVLVKVAAIRFTSPRNVAEGLRSHELLNGIYCTFTVCASDGTVIGCLDVPGPRGLKASNRDMKQKLFEECRIAYAVVRAGKLPSLEEVRAAFLGEIDPSDEDLALNSRSPISQSFADMDFDEALPTVPDTLRPASGAALQEAPLQIDMEAVAAARTSLRAKLERNRKIRFTNFDPLSASSDRVEEDVQEDAGDNFAVQWEDSFIMPQDGQLPESRKR